MGASCKVLSPSLEFSPLPPEEVGGPGDPRRPLPRSPFRFLSSLAPVSLREFYEKDGKELPGKKGLNLSVAEWETLVDKAGEVDFDVEAETIVAELGNKRRLTVNKFKGTTLVSPVPPSPREKALGSPLNNICRGYWVNFSLFVSRLRPPLLIPFLLFFLLVSERLTSASTTRRTGRRSRASAGSRCLRSSGRFWWRALKK